MKNINFLQRALSVSVLVGLALSAIAAGKEDTYADPLAIGKKLTGRFIESPHPNFDDNPAPTGEITYPETCTWLGALRFAESTGDTVALKSLESRLIPIFGPERRLQPMPDHVDHSVFGTVPLRLAAITGNPIYMSMGQWYADAQWQMPRKDSESHAALLADGLSWQTRYWIDDMFMISALQCEAYNATGDRRYVDRAAHEMVRYLVKIQRPNGLFFHSPEAPFHWARGNGWMAAGMTELLSVLPEDNPDRPAILEAYRKMMNTLLGYQKPDGLWGQLVDDQEAWSETSGSAMFTYAMISGVANNWLDRAMFEAPMRKAWNALVTHLDENGDIDEVCQGTNTSSDREFYLNRKRLPGNMHGQAPMLWCATALLKLK